VSYLDHRLTTQAHHDRLRRAQVSGRLCAACGRDISDRETVYIELFKDERTFIRRAAVWAPVGIECASTELLEQTQDQEPVRCAWCGRGVYYRLLNPRRHRAVCSRVCGTKASAAKQLVGKEPAG
jgi:hypothetical protein